MIIKIEIEDALYDRFKTGFLRGAPNQTEDWKTPLTDDEWIQLKSELLINGTFERGDREIQAEQTPPEKITPVKMPLKGKK